MPGFEKGDRAYLLTNVNGRPAYKNVKITAVKKQSVKNYKGQRYNVKMIGTKKQRQNVPEFILQHEKPRNWEMNLEGGRRRTRRQQRR